MQVPTPIVEGDGAFSFHIPLPNPKGPIRAFLDRVRSVLSMPLPPYFAPHLNSVVSRAPLPPSPPVISATIRADLLVPLQR